MRILVTGHKGFIGTVMVPYLEAAGHRVIGLDSDLFRHSTYGVYSPPTHELIKDVRDAERVDLDGVDAIVHLAALSNDALGDLNPDVTYAINHRATLRLGQLAKDCGIARFVFASSCSLYGASTGSLLDESSEFRPLTPYAVSKVLSERDLSQLADTGFSPTFLRNATAYGVSPRIRFDVVVNNLTAWAYTTGRVHLKSDGSSWRPIVHIEDIARAALAVLEAPTERVHNQAYNVGLTSENYQIKQLAALVKDKVPRCEVGFAADAGPDLRNYRVDFTRYASTFADRPLQWRAPAGVEQIYQTYLHHGLKKNEYEGPKYKRIAQLKQLLANGDLDETLRWRRAA